MVLAGPRSSESCACCLDATSCLPVLASSLRQSGSPRCLVVCFFTLLILLALAELELRRPQCKKPRTCVGPWLTISLWDSDACEREAGHYSSVLDEDVLYVRRQWNECCDASEVWLLQRCHPS